MSSAMPWILGGAAVVLLMAAASEAQREPERAPPPAPPQPSAHPPFEGFARARSRFGWRKDPVTGKDAFHRGIDIPLPIGTPVLAPWDGQVERIDRDGVGRGATNGNAVLLRAEGMRWAFLHLSLVKVRVGQRVVRGEVIALSGRSGRVTGPHLHIQIYNSRGELVDPETQYQAGLFGEAL